MKHVPWPVLAAELLCWSVLLLTPVLVFFVDIPVEIVALLAAGWFFWAYVHFIVPQLLTTYKVSLPKIGKNALKIALISDLHAGPFKGVRFFKRVVNRINQEKPDLILIPGDFLLGTAQKFAKKLEPLKNLCSPAFFTLGNHDHWLHKPGGKPAGAAFLCKKLREFGLQELKNSAVKWKNKLWIVGVDDNHYGFDDIKKAFKNVPNIEESIFLSHSPDIVDKFEDNKRPALTVCGHTHGGQMAFPWFIKHMPNIIYNIVRREFVWGWFDHERMFVTMGVGESSSRGRFWVRPEVAILNCVEEKGLTM